MAKPPKDLSPNSFTLIPAKEKIKLPALDYPMGQTLGGYVLGSDDLTKSGKSLNTVMDAISSEGNFINELISAKLNTQTKQILGDFTFGESGAIKMITDENNGLWLSPTGLLGKKAGTTTFAIDTEGNATYAGTITASQVVAGILTGFTIQTATSGRRMKIDTNLMAFYDSAGTLIGRLGGDPSLYSFLEVIHSVASTGGIIRAIKNPSAATDSANVAYFGTQGKAQGFCLQLENTSSEAGRVSMLDIRNTGLGGGITYLDSSDTDGTPLSLTMSNPANTNPVINLVTAAVTSTNFKKIINCDGCVIWKSDGTTPNGNLSGTAGDVCFGADSGKAYYCTGTTNWTAM